MEEEEIMLLSKGVKLLVADDERAMLLENDGTPDKPELRLLGARKAEPATEFSDRPGLANDRATGHGTTYDQGAPEEIARQRFAQALVGFAGAHVNGSRLVIAAPPRMLAALRAAMPDALSSSVVAEIDKTLTGHPLPELVKVLSAALDPV